MAAITVQDAKAPFAPISANGLDFTWAAGNTGGDTFVCTGREVLLFWNSHASNPYTFGVTSQPDADGRVAHIAGYSLSAGEFGFHTVGLTNKKGWKDSNGLINIVVENAAVKVAVLRLPAGYPQ